MKCNNCAELSEAQILLRLLAERSKKDAKSVIRSYHRNGHELFGRRTPT